MQSVIVVRETILKYVRVADMGLTKRYFIKPLKYTQKNTKLCEFSKNVTLLLHHKCCHWFSRILMKVNATELLFIYVLV